MTLSELAVLLGGTLSGSDDVQITGPAKIEEAKEGEVTFLSNLKYKHFLESTRASAVLLAQKPDSATVPYILVENPYVAFVTVLKLFEPEKHTAFSGHSPQAVIDPKAQLGDNVKIGPFVSIGPKVSVGSGSVLYPGVVLAENVTIGVDCVLYPNVSVREDCIIGDRVMLHNGCVIGSDGFGFAPAEGRYHKIPQIGNVILEDDVEIGANTTIDRATTGSTIIKKGTKLDNMIQIAHNVVVGRHTVIASQAGIAGSTEIGDHVQIGGQSAINGHIKIGDHVVIAARSGVTKTLQEKTVVWGTPAIPITQQKRLEINIQQLPKTLKRIKQLETEIDQLKTAMQIEDDNRNG